MNTATSTILSITSNSPMSAKQIASHIGLSESRVRELLADLVNVGEMTKDDTVRPAVFFPTPVADETIYISDEDREAAEDEAFEAAQNAATQAEDDAMDDAELASLPISVNPFSALTTAEVSDAVNAGLEQGQELIETTPLLSEMIASIPKAKKAPLNPQPEIDKKVAIMEAAGGSITYAARMWTITNSSGRSVTISSREFSLYKREQILDLFASSEATA